MGVIATNNREIKFYFSSVTSIGKQALAYVRASDKKILEIDIAKTKVTGTQWTELASRLDIPIKQLINTDHPDFVSAYGKATNVTDENDWFNILNKCPQAFHQPILVNKNRTLQIQTPSEIVSFLGSES